MSFIRAGMSSKMLLMTKCLKNGDKEVYIAVKFPETGPKMSNLNVRDFSALVVSSTLNADVISVFQDMAEMK